MKLLIEQGALQKALARVLGIVATRTTIPILENVAIDAREGQIWLTATDLVMEARARVDGRIEEEGEITASAALLGDLVRSAPSGAEVSLSHGADDPRLILKFGRSRYQVPVLPRVDFPVLPPLERPVVVTVQAVDLKGMIGRVAFAQSNDVRARAYLCGVHLHVAPKAPDGPAPLRMVATNGFRLALADVPMVGAPVEFPDVILPAKAVAEFSRALEGRAGEIKLAIAASAVILELEDAALRTKVIDGNPVDYMRVVPQTWAQQAVVDRQVLVNTARRIALVSDNKDRTIKVTFDGDLMKLQARSTESAQGSEELEIQYDGPPFEVAWNAGYLIDAISQTDADNVAFSLTDAGGPARVEPAANDPEHGPVLSILMPQRA